MTDRIDELRALAGPDGMDLSGKTTLQLLDIAETLRDVLMDITHYPDVRVYVGTLIHDKALAALTELETE